jgi:hypothetical protein
VAALLAGEGIPATLRRGWLGELTVWVDGRKVARRPWFGAVTDQSLAAAARAALALL